jgi:hypothetical protein
MNMGQGWPFFLIKVARNHNKEATLIDWMRNHVTHRFFFHLTDIYDDQARTTEGFDRGDCVNGLRI